MREIRISIAVIVSCLIAVGIVMIYSASGVYAMEKIGNKVYFLIRHLTFLGIGCLLMLLSMSFNYRSLQQYAKPMLVVTGLLLIFVLIPAFGHESFGARRWFKLGLIHFQPSELAKLVILIYAADYIERKKFNLSSFKQGLLPILLILGVTSALILKQPDLGNSVLILFVTLIMLFIAGIRLKHVLALFAAVLPVFIFLIVSEPYRMKRIVAFLDPWSDSQGAGFQLTQSQIALGSGGLFGLGPGQSVQKLFYLPAAHTDFILSIIGEEFGLIGTLVVVFLFSAFIWQGARLAKRIEHPFGHYLSIGIVLMLGLQAIVNIGVSIGAFPTKGLPLPFVSYGGSALIFHMISVGLLLNISRTEDLEKH